MDGFYQLPSLLVDSELPERTTEFSTVGEGGSVLIGAGVFEGKVVAVGNGVNVKVGIGGGVLVGAGGAAVVGTAVGGTGVGDGVLDGTDVFVLEGTGLVLVGGVTGVPEEGIWVEVGGTGLVRVGGVTGVLEGGIWVEVGGTGVLVNDGAGAVELKNGVGRTYGTHSLCPTWMRVVVRQLRAINSRYEIPKAAPIRESVSPRRT